MRKFVASKKKKPLEFKALDYDGNSQDVKLLSGMPFIARKNNRQLEIVNNQTFTIQQIRYKDEIITIQDVDQIVDIPFKDFQHMFYPAFCITIHKSQGSTFNQPYTIHEWDKLDNRLKYVALSRSTDINNILIS